MQFLDTRHFLSSVCKPVKTFTLLEKHSPFFSKSTYSNTPQQLILNMNCFYHVMLLTIMVKGSNLMVLNNIPGIKNSDQKRIVRCGVLPADLERYSEFRQCVSNPSRAVVCLAFCRSPICASRNARTVGWSMVGTVSRLD